MNTTEETIHPGFLPTAGFLKFLDTLAPTPRYAKVLADQEKERKAVAAALQAEREADWERARAAAIEAEGETRERGKRGPNGTRPKHVVTGRVHYMEDDLRYQGWRE